MKETEKRPGRKVENPFHRHPLSMTLFPAMKKSPRQELFPGWKSQRRPSSLLLFLFFFFYSVAGFFFSSTSDAKEGVSAVFVVVEGRAESANSIHASRGEEGAKEEEEETTSVITEDESASSSSSSSYITFVIYGATGDLSKRKL